MQREQDILEFIIEYKKEHDGNSPSYRQIQEGCEIPSLLSVHNSINILVGLGLVTKGSAWKDSRSLEVDGGKWTYTDAPVGSEEWFDKIKAIPF